MSIPIPLSFKIYVCIYIDTYAYLALWQEHSVLSHVFQKFIKIIEYG